MGSDNLDGQLAVLAGQVSEELAAAELPLSVDRIRLEEFIDGLGRDAWRVLVVLPFPEQRTWNRDSVYQVRQAATAVFDRLIAETSLALPGDTLAVVTTDNAPDSEIAVDENDDDPALLGHESS